VLYLHLLAALVLTLLGLFWLAILLGNPKPFWTPLRAGLAFAQTGTIIAFLPWMIQLPNQFRYFDAMPASWMTPASLAELCYTFFYWIPIGTPPLPDRRFFHLLIAAGVLAWLIIVIGGSIPWFRRSSATESDNGDTRLRRAVLLGSWVGIGFILLIWGIAALGLAKVFHSSRYTVPAVPILLFALSAWVAKSPPRRAALLIAPLVILSIVGQALTHRRDSTGGMDKAIRGSFAPLLPGAGEPLYLLGYELKPFLTAHLEGFDVRPMKDVVHHPETTDSIVVFIADPWEPAWPLEERLDLSRLENPDLSEKRQQKKSQSLKMFRYEGLHREEWRLFGTRPDQLGAPPSAVAIALPEDQYTFDGWSLLEIGVEQTTFRWSSRNVAVIRFPQPVAKGRYMLHLHGYRQPYPQETVPITIRVRKRETMTQVGPGGFEISAPIRVREGTDVLRVEIECPTWSPAEFTGVQDTRHLGFLFGGAWIEPLKSK
jgi:hypothetical protein